MNKNIKIIIFSSCLLLVIMYIVTNGNTIVFNHDKWINSNNIDGWRERKKMAQYLVKQQTLIGKTKIETIELLGEPEEYSNITDKELYYTIYEDYKYDIDPVKIEYLIVSLDSKNRVIKVIQKVIKIG